MPFNTLSTNPGGEDSILLSNSIIHGSLRAARRKQLHDRSRWAWAVQAELSGQGRREAAVYFSRLWLRRFQVPMSVTDLNVESVTTLESRMMIGQRLRNKVHAPQILYRFEQLCLASSSSNVLSHERPIKCLNALTSRDVKVTAIHSAEQDRVHCIPGYTSCRD